jgi:outer membrane receptor protein involved in Fe transport
MGHLSITGFLKRIDQPIENILFRYSDQKQNNILNAPYNTAPTDVKGITASFRTSLGFISDDASLLRDLTFFAGGTWQRARVPAGPIKTTITPFVPEHTLSGSPDYIINAGLTLQHAHFPAVTILYNRMADYITAVGSAPLIYLENKHSVSSVPDYRLKGRDQLDLQASHKFMNERIQLIAGVNNLTNSAYIQYQDLNGNKKFDKPLSLTIRDNGGGYYNSGVDNTVLSIKPQRTYYLTVSYLFH